MKTILILVSTLLINVFVNAQTKELILKFNHLYNGSSFLIDETYEVDQNKFLSLTRLEYYLHLKSITHSDGSITEFDQKYILVNPEMTEITIGNYEMNDLSNLSLYLGVAPDVNNADPTIWPSSHPLSLQLQSMHWGWDFGYIFVAAEGMVDTNGDQILETPLQYHAISNDYYTPININVIPLTNQNTIIVELNINYDKLFENINCSSGGIYHGQFPQNELLVNNFTNNNVFSIPEDLNATEDNLATNFFNPFSNIIEINMPEKGKIDIFNINGQHIIRLLLDNGRHQIDTQKLSNGFYVMCIQINQKNQRFKLVKK